jgi:hypothetical protein
VWYHTGARVVSPILILCWHSYSKSKALVIYLAETGILAWPGLDFTAHGLILLDEI